MVGPRWTAATHGIAEPFLPTQRQGLRPPRPDAATRTLAAPAGGEPDEGGDDIDPSRQAGIHAIEAYVPRNAVKAATLEKAHGVDGKYTQGLMMTEFCGTGEDEDPVSIGLSAVSRLMYRYNVKFEEVGMMYVGSESLLDRAKSIKSNLMMLFNENNCYDVEGCDTYNACYGGTAALLNCMNWLTSDAWDGRWAIAVATDIADSPAGYRFMTGCACVAMLVGVDAALVFERERCSHIINRWDFYKVPHPRTSHHQLSDLAPQCKPPHSLIPSSSPLYAHSHGDGTSWRLSSTAPAPSMCTMSVWTAARGVSWRRGASLTSSR